MKKIFSGTSASTALMLIFGIMLTFYPGFFAKTICFIFGCAAILVAAIRFLLALRKGAPSPELLPCILLLLMGIILIFLHEQVLGILPMTAGICFLTYGLLKLRSAFAFRDKSRTLFIRLLIPALLGIAFSLFLIFFRFETAEFIIRIIGIILLYNCLEEILAAVFIKSSRKKLDTIEGEFTESDGK